MYNKKLIKCESDTPTKGSVPKSIKMASDHCCIEPFYSFAFIICCYSCKRIISSLKFLNWGGPVTDKMVDRRPSLSNRILFLPLGM